MTRQQANKVILSILSQYVDNNPDMRFHQILHALNLEEMVMGDEGLVIGCKDFFYLESEKALERIAETSDKPLDMGIVSSDFMEVDKDENGKIIPLTDTDRYENGKIIPLSKRKSISFRQIIAYDDRMEDDPEEMAYLREEDGIESYEDYIKLFNIIENEIMIMKSPDWGVDSYGNGIQYHFLCGPSIGDECVSDSIDIVWYIEQVAERAGFKNHISTQLSENYHGMNVVNTLQAETVYQVLIDGFKKDGFKVIEVHP